MEQHRVPEDSKIHIGNSQITLTVDVRDGTVFKLRAEDIDINLSTGNLFDSYSCVNFFLGIDKAVKLPLLDKKNLLRGGYTEGSVFWEGSVDSVSFKVSFLTPPDAPLWYWEVELLNKSTSIHAVTLVYYMDKGLAPAASLKVNEYYNSHYIDCFLLKDPTMRQVLASRQNRNVTEGKTPWLLEGCLHGAVAFATDAEDFYGSDYRTTGVPKFLTDPSLPSRIVQGQYSLSALQSKTVSLQPGEKTQLVFFGMYQDDHDAPSSELDISRVAHCRKEWLHLKSPSYQKTFSILNIDFPFSQRITGLPLSEDETDALFGPKRLHEECGADKKRWSFFTDDSHVVLQEKDKHVPMPHGHIIRGGDQLLPDDRLLSVSCHMNGCFAAQMAVGNSCFNSFLTHPRSQYDILKANGFRIAIGNALLGMPSAFSMKTYEAQWVYKTKEEVLTLSSRMDTRDDRFVFSLSSSERRALPITVYIGLAYGDAAQTQVPTITVSTPNKIMLSPHEASAFGTRFPGSSVSFEIASDATPRVHKNDDPLMLVVTIPSTRSLTVTVTPQFSSTSTVVSRKGLGGSADAFLRPATIRSTEYRNAGAVQKLNTMNRWWAHNALVHLSVLHGLEQVQGAAWGVRDVLQGPFEALLAQENWEALKHILVLVFSAQWAEKGNWPQWFMLDSYHDVQDSHYHGDVIFWPIKALCEYIEACGEGALLYESIPYTDPCTHASVRPAPLWQHIIDALEVIQKNYLDADSGLLRYGGGDWNDTLQPADAHRTDTTVSVWTMGLAHECITSLQKIAEQFFVQSLTKKTKEVYTALKKGLKYIRSTYTVLPGFLQTEEGMIGSFIHPDESQSNLSYRLLPMIRFINARLFSSKQARDHLEIIEKHLWHPDGVKLLDRPVGYNGGVSQVFLRAEQSAFWGREVGLMYVHAHIRFIEALLTMGEVEKAWKALNQIIPINLAQSVPNAAPRQSNAYFSSSDALFLNRRDAEKKYTTLAEGAVSCRGGWRIYSSGPGMLLSLIKRWIFGFRYSGEYVHIDPVIPSVLKGTNLTFSLYTGQKVSLRVSASVEVSCGVSQIRVNDQELSFISDEHPYRKGGAKILRSEFFQHLDKKENVIVVNLA